MTITIDLPEDVGSELLADAREQGADPAALVATLIANVYGVASARGTIEVENTGRLTAIMSEPVLARIWDPPEEDEAWAHL